MHAGAADWWSDNPSWDVEEVQKGCTADAIFMSRN